MFRLTLIALLVAAAVATEVKECKKGSLPHSARVKGCDKLPCDMVKNSIVEIEIDFNVGQTEAEKLKTKVRATALGITIPYPLPDDVSDVCKNLMNGQQCPLDVDEDATYLFKLPIGSYPEIGVAVEVSILNQKDEVVSCFIADIMVKSQ